MAVEFCSVYTHKHTHTTTQHMLHLSMCVDQQQVACCAPLHPAEDVLTGGWAALSHQEVTAAGQQGLCLLSSQPGTEGSQRGTDIMGGGGVGVLGCQLQRWRLYHLPWNQSSFWSKRWSNWNCWPPLSDSTQPNGTTEEDNFALKPGFYQLYKIFMV